MKLILTSNGFSNAAIVKKCIEFVGKPAAEINFAVINEAYAVEHDDHGWILDDLNRIKANFNGRMELVNLLALDLDTVKDRIECADVIFVVGGHTDYLMSVFQKTGFDKVLPEILQRKVYVGVSAGAMVVGHRISTNVYSGIFGEGSDFGINKYLDLAGLAVEPHMYSPYFPDRTQKTLLDATSGHGGLVYGLRDGAAIVVEDKGHYPIGGDFIKIRDGSLESEK